MKLILTLLLHAATLAAAGGLRFSHMENGDRVEVTFHSKGCFHDSTSYYEVRKVEGAFSFSEYAIRWDKSVPPEMAEKNPLGTIALSKKDIAGLDKLLAFYRGEKEALSTTQDTIVFEFCDKNGLVIAEKLQDVSGGHGLDDREDVITFVALTKRFESKPTPDDSGNIE